jgi:type IV secretory pathway VirB6-like protein
MPGVFDLVMIAPDGRHFYLEAKSQTGRLSPEQQWFQGELILRAIPYVIFRNLADIEIFVHQNRIPNRLARAA